MADNTLSRPPKMLHNFRRAAILFAGGPAPAANAVISAAATAFLRNEIEVVGILDGAPAQSAGILPGDVFVTVDDEEVTGMNQTELAVLVRGRAGTTVDITLRREEALIDFTITRARIVIPNVEYEVLDGDYGYVKLNQFTVEARSELNNAFEAIDVNSLNGLVLDFRDNPGGLLSSAIDIASAFVEEGSVVIEDFGDGNTQIYDANGSFVGITVPIVLLVNEGSASANDVEFLLPVPGGISLSSFSTNGTAGDIDGAAVTQAMLGTGVNMGDVAPGDERTIAAVFEVTASDASTVILKPVWEYNYQICVNDTPTEEKFNATAVSVDLLGNGEGGAGGAGGGNDGGAGGAGNAGNNGGAGGAGGGADGNAYPEGGGFISCAAGASETSDSGFIGLVLLAGIGLAARRRTHVSVS